MATGFVNAKIRKALEAAHVATKVMAALQVGGWRLWLSSGPEFEWHSKIEEPSRGSVWRTAALYLVCVLQGVVVSVLLSWLVSQCISK